MTNYIWEIQISEGFFKVIAKNITKIKSMLDSHGLSDRYHRLVKIDEPRFLKPR